MASLGELALTGVDVPALHRLFRAHAPVMDTSAPLHMARARQCVAWSRAASAAGAGDEDELGRLAHYVHPDGRGLWQDVGAYEQRLRRLSAFASSEGATPAPRRASPRSR